MDHKAAELPSSNVSSSNGNGYIDDKSSELPTSVPPPIATGPSKQQRRTPLSPAYWSETITYAGHRSHYAPFLLLLSFASGAIDVFSVPALQVFVANNTGNIIYLAMGAAQLSSVDTELRPISAIIALAGSWLGSIFSGFVGHRCGKKKRGYVFGDMLLQALLVFLVVGLYWGHAIGYHDRRTEYVAVAVLSFSMGCQNVLTKGLGSPMTIPTQVATGAMSDLLSDPKILAPLKKNWPRNERVVFLATFFGGGVIGGLAYRYSSPPLCLLLTAIFKLLAAISILFM